MILNSFGYKLLTDIIHITTVLNDVILSLFKFIMIAKEQCNLVISEIRQ